MKQLLVGLIQQDAGQDLVEYTLLLAFVCLASAALFINSGQAIGGIWTQANTQLSQANSAAVAGAS